MNKTLETSTILGIFIAFSLIAFAIASGEGKPLAFIDIKSSLIVVGGTIFVTVACFSMKDVLHAFGTTSRTIMFAQSNMRKLAIDAITISDIARKKGLLELQHHTREYPASNFFKKNLNLAVDGAKPEDIEKVMEREILNIHHRHKKTIEILRKAAEIAPAMGLIGTLIGLVQMLGNLDDPSKIGPAMAIALLTTLYGAVISYMILLPLATKLERVSKTEIDAVGMLAEAVLSISKKEGPVKLEMSLNSYLPPNLRMKRYN